MRRTYIGGSALIEGLMMIGRENAAIAIRKPDGDILVEKRVLPGKKKLHKLPVIRGMVSFVNQMLLVTKAMIFSAGFADLEEDKGTSRFDSFLSRVFGDKLKDMVVYFSLLLSLAFSIGFFILLPNILAGLLNFDKSGYIGVIRYNAFEGLIRIVLFLGYLLLVSRAKDIRRVWEYHGAEHKTINCYEHGEELTVSNAMKYSTKNPRCGTSYMFLVLIVSIFFFSFLGWYSAWLNALIRLAAVPLVAGLTFELLMYTGKSGSRLAKAISIPGLLFQRLTTKEPDSRQLEVAISAFTAVLSEESRAIGSTDS